MPPKASSSKPAPQQRNGAGDTSTLSANGQPKRKRARGRGGRRRGGRRGGGGGGDDDDDNSSSSSSSDDSDSDESSSDDDRPVASTSTSQTAKPKKAAAAAATVATKSNQAKASTKGSSKKGKAKADTETQDKASEDDEEEEDSGSESDSSSASSSASSSSFLTTSSEEEEEGEDVAADSQKQQQQWHQNGNQTNGFDASNIQEDRQAGRRPEMTAPPPPPYIQFGADADHAHNVRAFGKPILWGLLPEDNDQNQSKTTNNESSTNSTIIEAETKAAEERYLRFREAYVSKMISRFGASLDTIRQKESDTMTESRLGVLIASIAGGADTFTSKNGQGIWKTKEDESGERELVLEALEISEQNKAVVEMNEGNVHDDDADMS